jgi:hypothetical protein
MFFVYSTVKVHDFSELEVVETVSRETVRTTLKKMNVSPG